MITYKELLGRHNVNDVSIEIQHNLEELQSKLNQIRKLWNKPMIVTSGFRSMEDHIRIYSQMGITDRSKIPMKSKHLVGQAADISDPDGKLYDWCVKNEHHLVDIGLWCEVKDKQKRVHFQTRPPGSGKRFFNP
jgi:uncharacterized protein YcbK (DUF882 family)